MTFCGNAQQPFITTWKVTPESLWIEIPIVNTPQTNYTVNFGDGTILTNQHSYAYHTYAAAGTYTVTISGSYSWIAFESTSSEPALKLQTLEQWGSTAWSSTYHMFKGCANLVINATDTPNLSQVVNATNMFFNCSKVNIPVNHWNITHITNMTGMFAIWVIFQ